MNYENLQFTLNNSELFLQRWGNHSAFGAFQPINEPWQNTPLEPLKDLYRKVRKLVQRYAPQADFIFHDAFIYDPTRWNDLFRDDDIDKVIMDHHYYWAFEKDITDIDGFCKDAEKNAAVADQIKYQVYFGEWALATDNCAQHLNGFNDGSMNSLYKCAQMACPKTYLPASVATDFDRNADILGPFGGNGDNKLNSIQKGNCFTDSLTFNQDQVRQLATCARASFEKHLNGSFLWTAHNEIEAKWDYIRAWDMMWLNTTEVPVAQQKKYPDFDPVKSIELSSEEDILRFTQ